ncbi:hypothetical protein ACTI_00830 [Actinoplanes sp. OR16]|nr:hypothetical protein ACTI_00830 [Actinoplanes sp. OR16]
MLADQLEQQVERAGEVVQPHRELAGIDLRHLGRHGIIIVGLHDRGGLFGHVPTVVHGFDELFQAHAVRFL